MDFWEKVFSHFKQTQIVDLATVDINKPRVRPVILIFFKERFWVATGSNDAKVKQITDNENIEFCFTLKGENNSGYIRGAGKAIIEENVKNKKLLLENIEFIKHFWQDPADPDFILVNIKLQEIEYLPIGQMLATRKTIEEIK